MNKIGEMLVVDGGTVKSEENGIVKGLAIVFGSPDEPDQSAERDFFTPETFIMRKILLKFLSIIITDIR
jgi:hypothetical protein